jgi:hypothetical protein
MQRILARAGASAENVKGELEYTVDVGALMLRAKPRPLAAPCSPGRQGLPTLIAGAGAAV